VAYYHEQVANCYHSYEKRLPAREEESTVLHAQVYDEFFYESGFEQQGSQPPIPRILLEDDDEDFEPEPDWEPLDLSDDEDLDDEEDALEEQAAKAHIYNNQLVAKCLICQGETINKHISNCGHTSCLTCWNDYGVFLVNDHRGTPADPWKRCPMCRQDVKFLIKVFEDTMAPRSELMDNLTEFVADIRHNPQQEFVNPFGNTLTIPYYFYILVTLIHFTFLFTHFFHAVRVSRH
jgi:hypothetical protein